MLVSLMGLVPINLITSLICEKQSEDVNTISLLFKIAYSFAQKGSIIYIICKAITVIPINSNGCLLQPSILERIHFRYFSSSEEVIQWCHQVHSLQTKPSVLLVSIKDYFKAGNLRLLSLCSALLDSMIYISRLLESKQLFFLAILSIDFNSFIPNFSTFFNVLWLATVQDNSLQLSQFQMKDQKDNNKIILNDHSTFEDLLEIFLNYLS